VSRIGSSRAREARNQFITGSESTLIFTPRREAVPDGGEFPRTPKIRDKDAIHNIIGSSGNSSETPP
jgi:hypothetical protein